MNASLCIRMNEGFDRQYIQRCIDLGLLPGTVGVYCLVVSFNRRSEKGTLLLETLRAECFVISWSASQFLAEA